MSPYTDLPLSDEEIGCLRDGKAVEAFWLYRWRRQALRLEADLMRCGDTVHVARAALLSAPSLTVTPDTLARAEALGFRPGEGDVLVWALGRLEQVEKVRQHCKTMARTAAWRTPAQQRAARYTYREVLALLNFDTEEEPTP